MDHTILGEGDHVIDLESGGTTSEEDGCRDMVHGGVNQAKKIRGETVVGVGEQINGEDKRKHKCAKKPPKPPRPPRGLSLDAADQRLIKEITQLAMLKRARIERMKAMKKMKAAKAASDNSYLYAIFITILFCLVLFRGMFSKGSSNLMSSVGSPEPAVATNGRLFSAQYDTKNLSDSKTEGLGSMPPGLLDQVSSSSAQKGGRRIGRMQ